MSEETPSFDHWAIVELFGHQRIAGRVTEAQVGGCSFVRIDVPANGDNAAYTRLLGNGSIYAINIVGEAEARAAATAYRSKPISAYELPELRQQQLSYDDEEEEVFNDDIPY